MPALGRAREAPSGAGPRLLPGSDPARRRAGDAASVIVILMGHMHIICQKGGCRQADSSEDPGGGAGMEGLEKLRQEPETGLNFGFSVWIEVGSFRNGVPGSGDWKPAFRQPTSIASTSGW